MSHFSSSEGVKTSALGISVVSRISLFHISRKEQQDCSLSSTVEANVIRELKQFLVIFTQTLETQLLSDLSPNKRVEKSLNYITNI